MKVHYLLLATALFFISPGYSQKFTIPVFPDTQEAVGKKKSIFFSQIEWLAAKNDSLKIPVVLHVGDLVNFDNYDQWEAASVGYRVFDRLKIPYAITLGNHDTGAVGENSGKAAPGDVNANLRRTNKFNKYFPLCRFTLQKGSMDPDKSDNAYHLFEAGGLKWMVVTLEFCAREKAAQWMSDIIEQHPDRNVIILTHFHLTNEGEINTTNAGYGDMKVNDIYDKYIKKHKNVLLVLSGHTCGSAWRVDKGSHGNSVYQILQDYQCKDLGYIRLLDIDVEKSSISAKMYSPYLNRALNDHSAFSFDNVKFIKP